jgi:achaete-scute complex protein
MFSSVEFSLENCKNISTANRNVRKTRKRRHVPHSQLPIELVEKRNSRERERIHAVNDAFELLQKHIPYSTEYDKMSKVTILTDAILYIKRLTKMLENPNGNVHDTDTELNVDTTGLNIENIGLNIDNRLNIDTIGINKYTELCVKSGQLDTCYETNAQTLCGIDHTEEIQERDLDYPENTPNIDDYHQINEIQSKASDDHIMNGQFSNANGQMLQYLTNCRPTTSKTQFSRHFVHYSDNGQSIQDQANYHATCGRYFSYCRVSNTQVYGTVQKLSGPYHCRKMLGDLTNCVQNNKNVQLTKCSAFNTDESVGNDITDIHTYDVQCHDKELCNKATDFLDELIPPLYN